MLHRGAEPHSRHSAQVDSRRRPGPDTPRPRTTPASPRVLRPCLCPVSPLLASPLASCSCTMKILLCDLLLLSLVSSVFSSCPKDCLTCREKLRPALDSFNLEVCILECEEKVFPSPLWTPCTKVVASGSWQLGPADPEHVAAALHQRRASDLQHLKRMPRVRSLFQAREETEPGTDEGGEVEQKQLQKRFGGFTGARKSARKLANQKRFSEFMRQYLVLSLQSSQRRRTLHQNGNV
ncbi:prepronociceptin isoform X2 [Dipodomys merriami]|uniref:prepronociceptin isoform X2 n=1 Tax=Dipodomys merriami TaxID=94247 RepID=UPI00384AE2C8